jgi:phosphate transport system permease protein
MRGETPLRRRLVDWLVRLLAVVSVAIALVPLVWIIATAVSRGLPPLLGPSFLTARFPLACAGANCSYGGIGPALEGTFLQVGLASLVAMPIGILGGVYLAEIGRNAFGRTVSFLADVMSGTPSIVVGLFTYTLFLTFAPKTAFTAIAGVFALSIIMLPVVVRTTEESLRLVPRSVREAAFALGIPRYRSILRIVLPTAGSAVVTGALLAVARTAGEAAPLLFTSFHIQSIFYYQGLDQPVSSVPPLIYLWSQTPYENWQADAWGMALVMILLMLALSLSARYVLARRAHLLGATT